VVKPIVKHFLFCVEDVYVFSTTEDRPWPEVFQLQQKIQF